MPFSSRKSAILKAREFQSIKPVFLDTETTGLDDHAEIIEICVVSSEGDILIESLVKPKRSIPLDAIRVHGITEDMVANAPAWSEVWPAVLAVFLGKYIGIYNAEFDLRMMKQSHARNGMAWDFQASRIFDVMQLYSQYQGTQRWVSLDKAGLQCGIPLPNSHRARDDAMLLRSLFQYIATRSP